MKSGNNVQQQRGTFFLTQWFVSACAPNSIHFIKYPKRIGFSLLIRTNAWANIYCDRIVFKSYSTALYFLIENEPFFLLSVYIITIKFDMFDTETIRNEQSNSLNSTFLLVIFVQIKCASIELIHGEKLQFSTWWNPFYGFNCKCSNFAILVRDLTFRKRKRLILHLAKALQCVWFYLQ